MYACYSFGYDIWTKPHAQLLRVTAIPISHIHNTLHTKQLWRHNVDMTNAFELSFMPNRWCLRLLGLWCHMLLNLFLTIPMVKPSNQNKPTTQIKKWKTSILKCPNHYDQVPQIKKANIIKFLNKLVEWFSTRISSIAKHSRPDKKLAQAYLK